MKAIIRSRGSKLSRIVSVRDAGKIETAYWKNVLCHLHVDGRRMKFERIVDYYHASLRLTTIADTLLLTSSQRTEWLGQVVSASGKGSPSSASHRCVGRVSIEKGEVGCGDSPADELAGLVHAPVRRGSLPAWNS